MNCKRYPTSNYILTRQRLLNEHDKSDLDAWLRQMSFDEIMQNPDSYFENTYITNFDLHIINVEVINLHMTKNFTRLCLMKD